MRRRFAAIEVAVKNQDNREHDIFDSDDYLQDHGGMVAAVRALAGRGAAGVVRRLGRPGRPAGPRRWPRRRPGSCAPGCSTPSGSPPCARHGYKGAFELAATVDYLFGYDATADVVEDWMYERVTAGLRRRPGDAEVLRAVEPVGAARRSPSGCSRPTTAGLWDASDDARRALRAALLEAEGWEEPR